MIQLLTILLVSYTIYFLYIKISKKSSNNMKYKINYDINPFEKQNISKIDIPNFKEDYKPFLSACREIISTTDYRAYFRNGELYDVYPRNKAIPLCEDRYIAYDARYIFSDGKCYDLEDAESILQMEIPHFNEISGMANVTFDLSYILKMRVGKEYQPKLAVPLAYKTANLMLASPIGWNKKDYFRLVIQLWLIGEFKYADYLLEELEKRLPFMTDDNYYDKMSLKREVAFLKMFDEDYVITGHSSATCEKCTPYQDRIYSLSGKDKRFPKAPDFLLKEGLHCPISVHSILSPSKTITKYIYTSYDDVHTVETDAIKYSNRPFVDDRSKFQKQHYENWIIEKTKREEIEKQHYNREYWVNEYNNHFEYQKIVDALGDKAPKSYSGYRRMKNNNTKNYQKIVELMSSEVNI